MKENQVFFQRLRRALRRLSNRASGDLLDNTSRNSSMDAQRRAATARDGGDIISAKSWYREAIISDPTNSGAFLNYINFLISINESALALEITQLLLTADPSSPDGIELFFELGRNAELSNKVLSQAIIRFSESVVHEPSRHRDALDFLIPHKRIDSLEEIANTSPDPVARAVSLAHLKLRNGTNLDASIKEIMELPDSAIALAHLWLARGKPSAAIEALKAVPKFNVPDRSLRRAIRRAKASGKIKIASTYASLYLTIKPNDKWARELASILDPEKPSNYLLGKKGFSFPKMKNSPAFEVMDKKVFYLLHNSLPYHSAGYATRTHGLLTELNRTEWTVDGVTRLGYPYDMPGMADIGEIPSNNQVDSVVYRRLLNSQGIEKKNPLFEYVTRYSAALKNAALDEKPAVLHAASNHWNGLAAVKAARELGIPSVYEVRGLWEVTRGSRNPEWARGNMFKFMARMEADAARGASRVFTITRALKEELVKRGVDGDKIQIIPNGVDTTRFTPQPRDEVLASSLGLMDKTVIGYVGSILDYEGIELMLEAAASLKVERSDFHVLIVGDGAELTKFQTQVEEFYLSDVVTFTGRVPHDQVESYYSLIDITPFPRLPLPVCEMVSPLKPFEAMAMGKAVIASDVDALAEIVTPGLNGLLHAKGDAGSLTTEIRRLLDDSVLRQRLGAQARDWVVEERDWKKLATVVSSAYEELWESLSK